MNPDKNHFSISRKPVESGISGTGINEILIEGGLNCKSTPVSLHRNCSGGLYLFRGIAGEECGDAVERGCRGIFRYTTGLYTSDFRPYPPIRPTCLVTRTSDAGAETMSSFTVFSVGISGCPGDRVGGLPGCGFGFIGEGQPVVGGCTDGEIAVHVPHFGCSIYTILVCIDGRCDHQAGRPENVVVGPGLGSLHAVNDDEIIGVRVEDGP